MALAFLSVAIFTAGWATGRWDFSAENQRPSWLRGLRLLAVCVCLVFAGAVYLEMTPAASRLLGPVLLEERY